MAIKTYNPKIPRLTKNELEVLELLVEAAKLIEPIYALQEDTRYPGANFYPHGLSKKEIEKAAAKDPDVLSPYTVVEKRKGKLLAIPYHEKYAKLLAPVASKLLEAAELTEDKEFGKSLKIRAESLLNGNYRELIISWVLLRAPYILDISIGPTERYDDKLFFTKTSYQAWVGVVDEESTKRVNKYKEMILFSRRNTLLTSQKVNYYDKVQMRIEDVIIFSGLIGRMKFIGVNLPNSVDLMEEYGSKITMFRQPNRDRSEAEIWPTFTKMFSPQFKMLLTEADLERGGMYSNIFHELAHVFLRYRNSEQNLSDLFPVIDELAAYVMGVKLFGTLLLKDVVSQHELESVMVAFLARCLYSLKYEANDQSKSHYVIGRAIFINYLIESGALREAGGTSWPNFTKMFFAVSELASILEKILSTGGREDAAQMIKRYADIKKLKNYISS